MKVLTPGRLRKSDALAQFQRELEAIGQLHSPHIISAHDAGEVNGHHILVTEFVDGYDLSRLVWKLGPLGVADACELVRQAALGLEVASNKGIVHQDVKPSNLMLTPEGQVKVLDLGLVSFLSDAESEIAFSRAMGTPDYMAPERWNGANNVDVRADVYSLGCTLYKLLVGHAPFSQMLQTVDDKRQAHLSDNVCALHTERDDVPGKLERIVHRMLAKSPDDRFPTPRHVAAALKPFCTGAVPERLVARANGCEVVDDKELVEVTVAPRPKASGAKNTRFYGSLAGAAALISAVVLAVGPARFFEPRVNDDDVRSQARARDSEARAVSSSAESAEIRALIPRPPLSEKIGPIGSLVGHTDSVSSVVVSHDGRFAATGGVDTSVRLWDLETSLEIRQFHGHLKAVPSVAFSPDGQWLASSSYDSSIRLWDRATGEQVRVLNGHEGLVHSVAFSPDGKYLASGGLDGTVRLWDVATGNCERFFRGHSGLVRCVAFSDDGMRIASAGHFDAAVIIWDAQSGEMLRILQGHAGSVVVVEFSPSGRHVLSGSLDQTAILWDVDTEEIVRVLPHADTVFAVRFIEGDHYALTGSADASVGLWHLSRGARISSLEEHQAYVLGIDVSPTNDFVLSSDQAGKVHVWPVPQLEQDGSGRIKSLAVAGAARDVNVISSSDRIWSAHDESVHAVDWDSATTFVSGSADGSLARWTLSSNEPIWRRSFDDVLVTGRSVALDRGNRGWTLGRDRPNGAF